MAKLIWAGLYWSNFSLLRVNLINHHIFFDLIQHKAPVLREAEKQPSLAHLEGTDRKQLTDQQ